MAGLLGTVAMTILMYAWPLIGLPSMDIMAALGGGVSLQYVTLRPGIADSYRHWDLNGADLCPVFCFSTTRSRLATRCLLFFTSLGICHNSLRPGPSTSK